MQSSMLEQQQHRGSPNGQAPVLLPPIQHFEGMQSQPQYAPPAMNGGQMHHPPPYDQNQYHQYQTNGAMHPSPMPSNGQNGAMRFPLPPQTPLDARNLSGGRHKKEIKRRTKTGCLTCRKRRIKCDEGHPSCRNCQKSKRECLGYDPIFKQQPGPAPIQPAPAISTTSREAGATPTVPSNQYQTYQGTGGTFVPAPAAQAYPGIEASVAYNAPLDPALSSSSHAALKMSQSGYPEHLRPAREVRPVTMDQLFSLDDVPPPYQKREAPPPISKTSQQEVSDFYTFHYAPGLDKLFETNWYTQRGLSHLQSDPLLLDFVAQCAEHFKSQKPDYHATQSRPSMEARLVWHLACIPQNAARVSTNGAVNNPKLHELLPRIDTLEHLLTGQFLDRAKVPPPPQVADNVKYNEQAFWHHLGNFTSIRDDIGDAASLQAINDSMGAMRGILGMLESRDVLYSVAVARHIGGRMADWNPRRVLMPAGTDQSGDLDKLLVAHSFVHTEEQRGTNQVVQRICGMSLRSWLLQKQQ